MKLKPHLAVALICALPGLVVAQTPPRELVPPLAAIPVNTQHVAPLIQRFRKDLASVEHVQDVAWGPRREAELRALYIGWRARLDEVAYDGLGLEDRIDWLLFARELEHRLAQLDFEHARYDEAAPLLPEVSGLIALAEARRQLEYADGRVSAETLERARKALSEKLAAVRNNNDEPARSKARHTTPRISPVVAYRAARILDGTREQLKEWYGFYAGYDPQFTWWAKQPYGALDKLMGEYATVVRDRLAGASDPETIVGDPIGRDALMRGLAFQMIDYTPEELTKLAERELAWCHDEMVKAAGELGYEDWRQALEYVKTRSPAPGEQPKLVVQLADEAIDYVVDNDLVTVPELARRDWRMTMLTPEYQLQAPFFLGGEDVWVAYPTDSMPHDKKLMALRGNNRHFSRAVVHHELIPGHHLQHFYNGRYQPQRELFDTPFWTEGWALYWEFLLWDRGFATSPEDRIGMLFWRSHRAARILFSLDFHLGRMTPDQAVDLLVERVGHERENARAEVRRSLQGEYGPLYQAAYMLGGLQFYALHRDLVGGGTMSDRQFHDAILRGGPMPVEMVRARLLDQPPTKDYRAGWRFYDLGR